MEDIKTIKLHGHVKKNKILNLDVWFYSNETKTLSNQIKTCKQTTKTSSVSSQNREINSHYACYNKSHIIILIIILSH